MKPQKHLCLRLMSLDAIRTRKILEERLKGFDRWPHLGADQHLSEEIHNHIVNGRSLGLSICPKPNLGKGQFLP